MSYLKGLIDFIMHVDVHLQAMIVQYGGWIYGILFAIIFIETGVVVMPLLPGDSLLFVAWSLSGAGHLNIYLLLILLFVAAVVGDATNYHIGKYFGGALMRRKLRGRQMVKESHIEKTKHFFEKYGKKTIILARFVPIVRTFAPFVAGIGDMPYRIFLIYNMIGAALRVGGLTLIGYFFGQIPFVQNNLEKVILWIIFVSVLPIIFEYIKHLWEKRRKS